MSGVLTCIRRFLRVIMVILNVLGGLCGLAILIVGAWALSGEKSLIVIAQQSADKFTGVPILLVVLGVFIILLAGVGVVGSIFNKTKWGRVLLIVYAITLAILVLMEIIGGVVAAVRKDDVAAVFEVSAEATFAQYQLNKQVWDNFQFAFDCCGVRNYSDFKNMFNISVPVSCCNEPLAVSSNKKCDDVVASMESRYIWKTGCVDAVKETLTNYLAGVAAVAIIFAIIQIIIVVVSIFVAAEKRGVKYDTMSPGEDKNDIHDDAPTS